MYMNQMQRVKCVGCRYTRSGTSTSGVPRSSKPPRERSCPGKNSVSGATEYVVFGLVTHLVSLAHLAPLLWVTNSRFGSVCTDLISQVLRILGWLQPDVTGIDVAGCLIDCKFLEWGQVERNFQHIWSPIGMVVIATHHPQSLGEWLQHCCVTTPWEVIWNSGPDCWWIVPFVCIVKVQDPAVFYPCLVTVTVLTK